MIRWRRNTIDCHPRLDPAFAYPGLPAWQASTDWRRGSSLSGIALATTDPYKNKMRGLATSRIAIIILAPFIISITCNAQQLSKLSIDNKHAHAIGMKIWQNECGCSQEKLLFWSSREPFPSLGIGHFIWFPQKYTGPYTQTFPALIAFLQQHSTPLPSWLTQAGRDGCPWPTQQAFYGDNHSQRKQELRSLLSSTIDLQAQFMILQCHTALQDIVQACPDATKQTIIASINTLATTSDGIFALVDYLNFKGSGLNEKERYNNQGWGLLQVLEAMITTPQPITVQSFSTAAQQVLRRRVANAPKDSPDARHLQGWINRVKKYVG